MHQASKSLQENPSQDLMEVYHTYLQPERDFLFRWLYLDEMVPPRQWDQPIVDTLIAKNLGPLLADPNILYVIRHCQAGIPL